MHRLTLLLPLVFAIWVAGSLGALIAFGDKLPVVITNLLSLAFLPFLPFVPLLTPLGMVAGYEAWRVPSISGFVLCTVFYMAILATLGRFAQRRRH